MKAAPETVIEVEGLAGGYGARRVFERVDFTVPRGRVFAIMGGSGCGKSTLLRHLAGLVEPQAGEVRLLGRSLGRAAGEERRALLRTFGLMFQQGALWSSLTLEDNVALPLEEFTRLPDAEIAALARLKLALVGLAGCEDLFPSELSGGMRKRAALARALALDPPLLFLDEPGAGLDPVNSRRLDDLILRLRDETGTTIVLVTHELASILSICDDSIMLETGARTVIARGAPRDLLRNPPNEAVRRFLQREAD